MTLYPAGVGSASSQVMYSGLDATAHRQQSSVTENCSWLTNADMTGDNIDDTLVLAPDWSTDCSRTVLLHGESALMHSSWCNVSLAVTTNSHTSQSINKLDGGYDSANYYASANMWQLQGQKCISGHIWPHHYLDTWPFDPKIWTVHQCLEVQLLLWSSIRRLTPQAA